MNKEDNSNFYRAIGNSIQENKNKIEKLEKQVDRLKKKNKQLKHQQNNWNELKEWLKDYGKNKDILVPVAIVKIKMQEIESRK